MYFDLKFRGTAHHMREIIQEELEAAEHIASTVRKEREANSGTQLTFSFIFNLGPQPMQ